MSEIIRIDNRTWRIEDNGVRFFLLEGDTDALVIDTGMNTPNAREIAEGLTTFPLHLLNTHADPDHISGNEAFPAFYMSAAEYEFYRTVRKSDGTFLPVSDGDIIDLGNRPLKIIALAGHTPGSIAVLDVNARVLIGGDSIQDGRIFMFGDRRNMALYIETLSDLWDRHWDEFDTVYPSHGSFSIQPEIIPKLIDGAKGIVSGKIPGKRVDFMGKSITVCDVGCATFLCK